MLRVLIGREQGRVYKSAYTTYYMSYKAFIRRTSGYSNIELKCDNYVIDERGIAIHRPNVMPEALEKSPEVYVIADSTYTDAYFMEIKED